MGIPSLFKAVCLSVLTAACVVMAGNVAGGDLTANNNVWGEGGNVTGEINLQGNITVPANLTLTIKPGTVVRGNNFLITVEGTITTQATVEDYIMLAQTALIINGNGPHTLNFVKMLPPTALPNAILINNQANVTLSHVEIQDFGTNGVSIAGNNTVVLMNFCTIGARSRAFNPSEAVSVNVASSAANANVTIKNSILGLENKSIIKGLAILCTPNNVKVSHTFITGDRVGTPVQETNVYRNVAPGVFDIPNTRFYLDTYSPAIDAADPNEAYANEPQPNGGRADCGFYGNTKQATPSALQIRNPHKLSSLTHGNTYKITWWGGMFGDTKKLQFSSNKGQNWEDIGTASVGDTSFNWTVKNVKTQEAAIRISYSNHADVVDTSDWFAIDTTVAYKDTVDTNRVLKDPKPFICIGYNGYHVGNQDPRYGVEPPYAQVRADLEHLKNYTHAIRTYGCGLTTHGGMYVPDLCDELELDLHMGIWLNANIDATSEAQDKRAMDDALAIIRDGHTSIKSIVVGNEFLFRAEHKPMDMNTASKYLLNCIRYMKSNLPQGSKIKVTTGESYPNWKFDWGKVYVDSIIAEIDFLAWHVHPWWESKPIELAAEHVSLCHAEMKKRVIEAGFPDKPTILAETGWPSAATQNAAVGSEANQAKYLQDLHKYAFSAGLEYWFFEAYNEPWKGDEGSVGANWGIWNGDRSNKRIINNITTLVPPKLQWENPNLSTPVRNPQGLRQIQPGKTVSYNEIRIYDLKGRLVSRLLSNQKETLNALMKRQSQPTGIYMTNYLLNGTVVRTERNVMK